jgi:Mn-dependent DtxR family transcriptional regulator
VSLPAGAIDGRLTRALSAVIRVQASEGRVTVAEVAEELGVSTATASKSVRDLGELGLVVGVGVAGALRAAVWPVERS